MGEMSFFEAHDATLRPLLAARGLLDVVHVAERSGLMQALREPAPRDDLAAASGLPAESVTALLDVLEVNGVVVVGDDDRLRLSEPWQVLTGPAAFSTLGDNLDASDVERASIRSIGSDATYWDIDAAQRLSFARSVSPSPFQPGMVAMVRTIAAANPDLAAIRAGGTFLELGCGVAGRILASLQAIPEMRAVGVELSPDLADEARRRAEALGVADRFEVVTGDAADFDRPDAFDGGFWSQFFFPSDSRAPALRVALRSLRSGAVLMAPLLGDPEQLAAEPQGEEARGRAAFRVVLGSWGVPDRSPDELVAEIAGAGFVDVAAQRTPYGTWAVRAVRP